MSMPRRLVPAHRVAFFLTYGHWPENNACHHCDNPPCCRPSHLFDGTYSDNTQDALRKGRLKNGADVHNGENHAGHKLTGKQVYEIRSRYDARIEMVQDIAKDYGVTPENISAIGTRRTWKRLEEKEEV